MIDRFERFTYSVFELARLWHKIASEEFGKYGLKGSYAVYLSVMCRFPEGITAAKICEMTGKDKADVSRAIAAMIEKGLISRAEVEDNKKAYRALLTLTENGLLAAEHVNARVKVAVEKGGEGLSDAEREIFYGALELIVKNLQEIEKKGLPE